MSGVSSFMNSSYLQKNGVESTGPTSDLMKVNDFINHPKKADVEISLKDLNEPVVAVPAAAPINYEDIADETPTPRLSAAQIISNVYANIEQIKDTVEQPESIQESVRSSKPMKQPTVNIERV